MERTESKTVLTRTTTKITLTRKDIIDILKAHTGAYTGVVTFKYDVSLGSAVIIVHHTEEISTP